MSNINRVAIIGLGYVGLPLAIAMAESNRVIGYDIQEKRILQLIRGYDRNNEASSESLTKKNITWSSNPEDIRHANFYIITVPTPVDTQNKPDLTAILSASRTVGTQLKQGSIVIYESTVWPGLTEEECVPELEISSGLKWREGFNVGYSPERINPGDTKHTLKNITKIVAGDTEETTKKISELYAPINCNNIYNTPDIRTAEAAKVIENAQRDINIAFVNEVSQICHKLGLSSADVLEAASTKWNFLNFSPGLVGGHCIGVDPYYLAYRAEKAGHRPEVILAGRYLNDGMSAFISSHLTNKIVAPNSHILVLGLTFKKNVSDLRNSLIANIVKLLEKAGHIVDVYDPLANHEEAEALYSIKLIESIDFKHSYDCVVGAVGHDSFVQLPIEKVFGLLKEGGLLADIPGMWKQHPIPSKFLRWQL